MSLSTILHRKRSTYPNLLIPNLNAALPHSVPDRLVPHNMPAPSSPVETPTTPKPAQPDTPYLPETLPERSPTEPPAAPPDDDWPTCHARKLRS